MRSDHVPTLAGDSNDRAGYSTPGAALGRRLHARPARGRGGRGGVPLPGGRHPPSRHTVVMSGHADDDEWLRPVDLMVDSYAPEEIARRARPPARALRPRSAQARGGKGSLPNADALHAGIRGETGALPLRPPLGSRTRGWRRRSPEAESRARSGSGRDRRLRLGLAAPPVEGRPWAHRLGPAIVGDDRRHDGSPQAAGGRRTSSSPWDTAPAIVEWRLRLARTPRSAATLSRRRQRDPSRGDDQLRDRPRRDFAQGADHGPRARREGDATRRHLRG